MRSNGRIRLLVAAVVAVTFLWSGCDAFFSADEAPALPEAARLDLQRAQQNWAAFFAESGIALEGWEVDREVTASSVEGVREQVTDLHAVRVPSGSVLDPSGIKLRPLAGIESLDETERRRFINRAEEAALIGRVVVSLQWRADGETLSSTALVDDDGIEYDPILSTAFLADVNDEHPDSTVVRFGWMWEDVEEYSRGRARAVAKPTCFQGTAYGCESECSISFARFNTERKGLCQEGSLVDGECGMTYLQGVATGSRKLVLSEDSTRLDVTDGYGLYWTTRGSCTGSCAAD